MQYYFRSVAGFLRNFAFIVNSDIKPHFFKYTVIIQDTPLGPHNLQDTPVFEKLFRIPPKKGENYSNYPRKT